MYLEGEGSLRWVSYLERVFSVKGNWELGTEISTQTKLPSAAQVFVVHPQGRLTRLGVCAIKFQRLVACSWRPSSIDPTKICEDVLGSRDVNPNGFLPPGPFGIWPRPMQLMRRKLPKLLKQRKQLRLLRQLKLHNLHSKLRPGRTGVWFHTGGLVKVNEPLGLAVFLSWMVFERTSCTEKNQVDPKSAKSYQRVGICGKRMLCLGLCALHGPSWQGHHAWLCPKEYCMTFYRPLAPGLENPSLPMFAGDGWQCCAHQRHGLYSQHCWRHCAWQFHGQWAEPWQTNIQERHASEA